ncbi:MAG: type II toxin-antitoxin system PemK/MazF family toxin [Actinomycetota bacterium]
MSHPHRGEVWWVEMPGKRRPVLVLTREAAVPVLRTLLVAPVTRRIRGLPTEVLLDHDDGMPTECAVTLDNVTLADKAYFAGLQARLSPARMAEVCRALRVAAGC